MHPTHTLTVTIQGLGFGAEGWAMAPEGHFLSLPHTLPGDTVEAVVGEPHRGRAWGQALRWLHKAPQHVDPACQHYDRCSGCATRHMDPDHERDWKLQATAQILRRYGPHEAAQLTPGWLCANTRLGHRARGALRAQLVHGELRLGLRSTDLDHAITHIPDCPAQSPRWRQLMTALASALAQHPDAAAQLDSAELRTSPLGGALLLISANGQQIIDFIVEFATQHDISAALTREGQEPLPLRGEAALPLPVADRVVDAPWSSWTHTHPAAAALLAAQVDQWIGARHRFALDLCCGIGTLALTLARRLDRVIAVDEDHRAVQALASAAADLPQLQARAGRLGAVLRKLLRELHGQPHPTAAIINPMRSPLGAAQLRDLPALGVEEIIYLGPAPASAARDAATLRDLGYVTTQATAVNLHPGTARFLLALTLQRA